MVNCLDVDANKLIEKLASKLEKKGIEKPEYVKFVKSGAHAERPPAQENFWYIRCASIMRQNYANANVGVNRLRRHYGGLKDRGRKPERHMLAGGSTIRKAFQSLEKAGFLVKKKTGRELTPQGVKLLEECAKEVK